MPLKVLLDVMSTDLIIMTNVTASLLLHIDYSPSKHVKRECSILNIQRYFVIENNGNGRTIN
uniref:Uncharacterized protein n=1 Tax=Heterorhabditis bacteriophora TaxID=37862 RepID=A0A1I7XH90_HETBA